LSECLWLVRNGIPFDVAFQIDPELRAAMAVQFSIFEGRKFNLKTMQFEEEG